MRPWIDFISHYMDLSDGVDSPLQFKLWSAITAVSGALERRVWVKSGRYITFPNLFTLLVGDPGVGKFVIETTRELWNQTIEPGTRLKAFHVAPDSMTKASLIDTLGKAKSIRLSPSGPPITYHTLLVAAEEFAVLLPAYDTEYIGTLNSIFNNKALHEEARRHGPAREVKIENPQLIILGGAQPAWLGSTFPEDAWNTGLARRLIMIYGIKGAPQDIFASDVIPDEEWAELLRKLGHLSQLAGQMSWMPDAADCIRQWNLNGGPPVPMHSKLKHYNNSRTMHLIKLAAISAASRTGKLVIHLADITRAMAWLFEAEKLMPDIFREMVGKSDKILIEELHLYMVSTWEREKRKPITGGLIRLFLLGRMPHEKVEGLILMAERANIIARQAGTQDLWIPQPKSLHGME